MKKLVLTALVLLAAPLSLFAQVNANTIYGEDDRVDLYQVKDPGVRKLADSTVALFQGGSVTINDKTAVLATRPYGESNGLCKDVKFYDQHEGAFCSGSLVAPDVIMTAGHCVTDQDSCLSTKFVFGFSLKAEGDVPDQVPASEVYGCSQLLGRQQENAGDDWALIKLDRPVTGHAPLRVATSAPAKDSLLCMIGHPTGLPTKVACGKTKVRDASPEGYFVANTDSYHGNSGSAVFSQDTGLIVGVLVRGDADYEWNEAGQCQIDKVFPEDGGRGEDVTKITSVPVPKTDETVVDHPVSTPESTRVAPIGKRLSALIESAKTARFDN